MLNTLYITLSAPLIGSLLVASLSLLLVLLYQRSKKPIPYLLVCLPYLLAVFPFVLFRELPAGDSHTFWYPSFEHILNAVRDGYLFPQWFPTSGGVRIGLSHITFSPTLPHRILGCYLYSFLPFSSVIIYKLGYISGVMLMCFGWWLVLNHLTGCRLAAYFGTLMIMMGGAGITFHQEQVLGVTCYIPWFVYSILKIRDDPRFIFPAAILFGLGLTVYYPQIEFISMGLFIVVMAFFSPSTIKNLFLAQKRSSVLLLILFILALLPALYLLKDINNLACDTRKFSTDTYPEYLKMNQAGLSSASSSYFHQYIKPTVQDAEIEGYGEMPDRCSLFVGRIALVLALFGIISMPRKAWPIIIFLVFFIALTLGINSPISIPSILFMLRFPTINLFREWVHFFPMINFCLSALAALGFAGLVRYRGKNAGTVFSILIPIILFIQIADLSLYDRQYITEFKEDAGPDLESQFFSRKSYSIIRVLQYKNRHGLYHICPEAIPLEPYLTTNIITVPGREERDPAEICSILSRGDNQVIIDTPIPSIFQSDEEIGRLSCPAEVTSRGLMVMVSAPGAALLVPPLNYDLRPRAFLDGEEVMVARVNGALSGVFVPEGIHSVSFRIPWDIYWPLVWIQWLLYVFLAAFFIVGARRERNRDEMGRSDN